MDFWAPSTGAIKYTRHVLYLFLRVLRILQGALSFGFSLPTSSQKGLLGNIKAVCIDQFSIVVTQ